MQKAFLGLISDEQCLKDSLSRLEGYCFVSGAARPEFGTWAWGKHLDILGRQIDAGEVHRHEPVAGGLAAVQGRTH